MRPKIDNADRILAAIAAVVLLGLLACASGCVPKESILIRAPDSPVLILEARGKLRIASYSKARNALVEIGWVNAEQWESWTLTKFDWEKYAEERRRAGDGQPPD